MSENYDMIFPRFFMGENLLGIRYFIDTFIFEFSFVCHGKIGVVHNKLGKLIIYKFCY